MGWFSKKNIGKTANEINKPFESNRFTDAFIWISKGNTHVENGMYSEAIQCYDKALEINPVMADVWNNKGLALARIAKYEEAVTCYDKAIDLRPDDEEVIYNKGIALAHLGRTKEAIECYDKILEKNPLDAGAWCIKGDILFESGDFEGALQAYDRSIEANSRDETVWNNRGLTLVKLNRLSEAIESYDKALEINPKVEKIWSNKGLAIAKMKQTGGSIHDKRIDLKPGYTPEKNMRKLSEGKIREQQVKIAPSAASIPKHSENKNAAMINSDFCMQIFRGYSVNLNNDIKFGIRLINNTDFVIIDADTILDYTKSLFSMKDSEIQHLGNIMPNNARTATYILKPLGCIHNEQINALITYKDHTGKKQTLQMRPKEVHCVCPFLKVKTISEGEYSRLAASSEFVQEGISFKGISVEELAKLMGETCKHTLHKVREYDLEGKKVIYLSGESIGEKTYYLLTAVIQEYKDLTQVVLRAYSNKKYGLNGFMNEMADSMRHLVGSVQNAKEIGIIENTQVINIIDSVVQRTSFNMGEGGNAKVNIKDSVVQRSNIGNKD